MTDFRTGSGVLPTDTSTVDVTFSGSPGTPDAVIVLSALNPTLNTQAADECWGIGFSDFTDQGGIMWGMNNNTSSRFSRGGHQAGEALCVHDDAGSSLFRSATIAAITDGVRLTPIQSAGAIAFVVICIFGGEWKMFNGDITESVAGEHDFVHTLSAKPNIGFFACSESFDTVSSTPGTISFGFFADEGSIVQRSVQRGATSGGSGSAGSFGIFSTNRVCARVQNGSFEEGYELTGNDGTNTTITCRDNAVTNGAVICLLGVIDETVEVVTEVSPNTDASDWNVNSASELPQAVIGVMTQQLSVDTHTANDNSCCMSVFCMTDSGEESCCGGRHNDGADPSENDNFIHDVECSMMDDTGSSPLYEWVDPTFTADGFDVTAANIAQASTTTHQFAMLFIGAAGGGIVPQAMHHYRHHGD